MKVLAIENQSEQFAKVLWGDAKIYVLKGDDFANPPKHHVGKYDAVLAFHILPRVLNAVAIEVVRAWGACLKEGGELHLFVPSLEWAARQVLAEEPSPLLLGHLYGHQNSPEGMHLSGYTMRRLRANIAAAGLKCEMARTHMYTQDVQGEDYQAEHHYVAARK